MTIAEAAKAAYTARSVAIEEKARKLPMDRPLRYRRWMHYGKIAYRAAKAEEVNPEPRVAVCGLCGGIRQCDLYAHGVTR